MVYKLNYTQYFTKKSAKLLKKNRTLQSKLVQTLDSLAQDPRDTKLKSHKVTTPRFGDAFSSSVTGDIRIIWEFNGNVITAIDLLDIGGHSGTNKVY